MSGDGAASGRADVLDTGPQGRFGPWTVVVVVAVLALVGWSLRSSPGGPAATPVAAPTERDVRVAEPDPQPQVRPVLDHAGAFAFVDDSHGFLLQHRCSLLRSAGSCTAQLLVTGDGGQTWDSRGAIPPWAESLYSLVAISEQEIVLIDGAVFSSLARSVDGGLTWARLPINRGPPAPAPAGATVLQEMPQVCYSTECAGDAVWLDVGTQTVHPLPQQPPTGLDQFLGLGPMSPDGELVASTGRITSAQVAMSVDGGRSWTATVLDVPVERREHILHVQSLPAGNGRAYAFVQVYDGVDAEVTYGFRTDDAGRSWVDLQWDRTPVRWFPAGVLDGELITTTAQSNGLQVSSGGGTRWAPLEGGAATSRDSWLRQIVPDGPMLLTTWDGSSEILQVSVDGRTWTRVDLPA